VTISAENNNYYQKFHLIRDPFPLDVIDKVLYLTPELNHRLEILVTRINCGGPVQAVISPTGGGKTVIAEYLASLKQPNWLVGMVQGNTGQDKESLSLAILNKIFPDHEFEHGQAVNQLHTLLGTATLNGKIPVLIIDDAHQLSPGCLAFILQLAAMRHDDSRYRIVLFANESLNDHLDQQGMQCNREEVLTELNLPPLSPEQTKAYIENRLSLSGEINNSPFTDTDLSQIARISAGLPGGINLLARQAMQQKLGDVNGHGMGRGRMLVAVCAVAILSVTAGYYYVRQWHTRTVDKGSTTEMEAENQTDGQRLSSPAKEELAGPSKTTTIEQQLFAAQVSLELPQPVTSAEVSTGADVPASAGPESAATPAPDLVRTDGNQPVEAGQDQNDKEVDDLSEQPAVSHEDYGPDNIYRLDSVPDIVKGINGPDWFRQQAQDLFVLQILSVGEFTNLEKMLRKIPELQGQLSGYTNYTPSGNPRYLLYYGLYKDRQSAVAAVRDIPTPLQTVKPWPRDIRSIVNQLDSLAARGYY